MQFLDIIVYIGVAIITIVIIMSATNILSFRYKRQLETLWGNLDQYLDTGFLWRRSVC